MLHTTSPAAPGPDAGSQAGRILARCDALVRELDDLSFCPPASHVYQPLAYAREPFRLYAERFLAGPPGRVLWLGLNPGPFGMAQTGVPFGAVPVVRDWMGIEAPVGRPPRIHPKRPVDGFACARVEVSGERLWGLFSRQWPDAAQAFARHAVLNWCPLVFMDEGGANITPDKLPAALRAPLEAACDRALDDLIRVIAPRHLVGVGGFAARRLEAAAARLAAADGALPLPVTTVLHPSPASPAANRGWEAAVRAVLEPARLWP